LTQASFLSDTTEILNKNLKNVSNMIYFANVRMRRIIMLSLLSFILISKEEEELKILKVENCELKIYLII